MKINFVIAGIYKSGGMKVIFKYASELSKKGHDVFLYRRLIPYNYMSGNLSPFQVTGTLVNKLKKVFFRMKTIEPYPLNCVKIVSVPLINNLFIRNADITIATEWVTAYSVNNLSESKGVKIYLIQGYEYWNSNKQLVNDSYKLQLERITVSKSLRNFLIEKFGSDSKLIMNGIDYDEFFPESGQKNKNEITISFIYHRLKYKNTDLALSVANQLHKKYSNVKLVSFGTDKANLPDYIDYHENPDVKTIRKIYSNSDIFLFTSELEEGFGLPPAEAMSCRCAVVTTKSGAIPDYSSHLETALHVDNIDAKSFLDAIEYLINNRSEIDRIANNAFKSIKNILSWEQSVLNFEKCLLELTEQDFN
jgi:glycosyltransferase involved in cell wall biosynthesis